MATYVAHTWHVTFLQVQADFATLDATHVATTLADADSINHLCVFMTGAMPLPDGFGGAGTPAHAHGHYTVLLHSVHVLWRLAGLALSGLCVEREAVGHISYCTSETFTCVIFCTACTRVYSLDAHVLRCVVDAGADDDAVGTVGHWS